MKAIKVLLSTLALLVIGLYVSGHGYIVAGMQETYFRGWKNSNIDDIEFRDLRTIAAAENPSPWIYQPVWNAEFSAEDAAWHEEYMSAAFLVLQGDTLRFERYWQGFDEHIVSNSFSACKSIVAMVVGLAVQEGLVDVEDEIGSDDDIDLDAFL